MGGPRGRKIIIYFSYYITCFTTSPPNGASSETWITVLISLIQQILNFLNSWQFGWHLRREQKLSLGLEDIRLASKQHSICVCSRRSTDKPLGGSGPKQWLDTREPCSSSIFLMKPCLLTLLFLLFLFFLFQIKTSINVWVMDTRSASPGTDWIHSQLERLKMGGLDLERHPLLPSSIYLAKF